MVAIALARVRILKLLFHGRRVAEGGGVKRARTIAAFADRNQGFLNICVCGYDDSQRSGAARSLGARVRGR